ncbi:TPA: autotransporter outer membrane beta-barrel domain-containing protein, partial [Citrobacter rodentium]|nr:autotransporter outer membrane beta-barrel domain-containing protein [Citrobacter rodentium]
MKITAFRQFSETQRAFSLGICCIGLAVYPGYTQAATIGSQTGVLIEVSNGDHIVADTADDDLYGIKTPLGQQAATVRLGSGVTVTADDPERNAKGVMVEGADSVLTADRLTINVSGKDATGLWLFANNIQADLGTGSVITASTSEGSSTNGVVIRNGSALTADQLTVETAGYASTGLNIGGYGSLVDLGSESIISASGRNSYGIFISGIDGDAARGPAQLTATALSIKAEGNSAYGMYIQKNAVVDIGTGSVITAAGDYAMGITSFGQFNADALTIDVQGSDADGIEARGGSATIGADTHISSAAGSALVASEGATIDFRGSESARNTLFSGGGYAAAAVTGAAITLSDTDITVGPGGDLGLGLVALDGGTISGKNLSITGAAGTRGIYAMTGGSIDLTGDLSVSMASADETAFYSTYYEGYAPGSISATGKMLIVGSADARGGKIDIDMAPGSVWTGKALSDNVNGGYLNVSLNDSVWNISGSSNLDNLSLTGSTVDFASMASDPDVFSTLTVASLSGNGSFVMRTDLVGDGNGVNNGGDLLRVTGSSAGSHLLTFKNQGSMATTGNEVLTVVETADGGASFTAASDVELGGYLYRVRQSGTDWELYSSAQAPDPVPTPEPASIPEPAPTPVPAPAPDRPQLTSAADAGGNYLNVGYVLSYVETSTLMQRMGDLRQQNGKGDMWIRGYGGKADSFSGGTLDGFSMNYSGIQIGADKRVSEDLPLSVGLFLG